MEKLLITGVNGLLGQNVLERAISNFNVFGIDLHDEPYIKKNKFEYQKLDLTDRQAVRKALLEYQPDYLINTAAMTDVDGCENQKEKCWKINVEAVENIVHAARKSGSKIVHLSSDYVFDGKAGPYSEKNAPNPVGFYGKSKLASENILISSEMEYAIVRTMVLYGTGEKIRPNFVSWLLEKLRQDKNVSIVTDQFGNPTLADDLAEAILKIIELKKWDIYHISGSELVDRYHFALKIADIFKLDKSLILSITTPELKQSASRPLKSGFVIEKANAELGIRMSNVEEGLKILKKQYKKFRLF